MQDKDAIIKQLIEENKKLREYIKLLEEKIARIQKNSNNSSKPPSSDIVKPKKVLRKVARKKRKRGGQHGHRKFSRRPLEPEQVDETGHKDNGDKHWTWCFQTPEYSLFHIELPFTAWWEWQSMQLCPYCAAPIPTHPLSH